MKKITIFAGHYGSGKTNLAVNAAIALRAQHERVILCDLDTVNPYFRTKDSEAELTAAGVRLISPRFANTNVDLPYLPAEVAAIFAPGNIAVADVGGDDAGAIALGQYAPRISAAGYDMLLVVNERRYMTGTPDEALSIMREIESASKLQFTGLVNNTNLGRETTSETVTNARDYMRTLSEKTGLPIVATSYREDLSPELTDEDGIAWKIRIYDKPGWAIW
jgi:hypothetical protein